MSVETRAAGDPEAALVRYLRRRADAEGEFYCKSKFVVDDIDADLTPSQVGRILGGLRESADDLEVERWAYTNATTWRVAPTG